MNTTDVCEELKCYHCGEPCTETLYKDDKAFCCLGCRTVYDILSAGDLCEYYTVDERRGTSMRHNTAQSFSYLDEPEIRSQLLSFDSDSLARVTFAIPAIHCISCIWLLEKLRSLEPGIIHAEVIFTRKVINIAYDPSKIGLSNVAALLSSIGYAPNITLEGSRTERAPLNRTLVLKLAIAGFGFANIMLFSFPEYLGIDKSEEQLMRIFSWLNLAIATPVFLFSGNGYLRNAIQSLRLRQLNIDVPIAAGLVALYFRSAYDILTHTGPGYLDSLTGLIFFLLIGRWFQGKTYDALAFDRDYTSYFPLAVNRWQLNEWVPVLLGKLKQGDRVRIRNMEIVPADSTLSDDEAFIDYSFVTGESKPVHARKGAAIYAGGRVIGAPATFIVRRETSQSQLTSLWNHPSFTKAGSGRFQQIMDRAARYFTWIVLALAVGTGVFWYFYQPPAMWLVLTSVLMVACPCALALATPFTLGSMMRVLGRHDLYLRNAEVIERMATIDTIVFDKTGTLTTGEAQVRFMGDTSLLGSIRKICSYSTHPLSAQISNSITAMTDAPVTHFNERPGLGVEGVIEGRQIKVGSAAFNHLDKTSDPSETRVYVSVNGDYAGYFSIDTRPRKHIQGLLRRLNGQCHSLISGDGEADRIRMESLFPSHARLLFNQSPQDKMAYIRSLQRAGRKVMMIGDGLNDAGALKQADVGIAVSDNKGVFSPACDGIISGERLQDLDRMMAFSRRSSIILKAGFTVSFFYNAIALSFAVTGNLTPLVAAVIMPISSVSVVGFSTLAVEYAARKLNRP